MVNDAKNFALATSVVMLIAGPACGARSGDAAVALLCLDISEQPRAKTELSDDSEFHRVNVALAERGFDGGDTREQPVEREHDHEEPESQSRRRPAGHRANAKRGRQGVLKVERLLRLVRQPRVYGISSRSQPDDERGDEQENRTADMSENGSESLLGRHFACVVMIMVRCRHVS